MRLILQVLKTKKSFVFICCAILIMAAGFPVTGRAQNYRSVTGSLVDSTGKKIAKETVNLETDDHQVLSAASDSNGTFTFSRLTTDHFNLSVQSLIYQWVSRSFVFGSSAAVLKLKPIVLKEKMNLLRQVNIARRPARVVVKKDTIEFDAAAYRGDPDELLEDLLKRIPGVQVDIGGNASYVGQSLKKLRVNGKDFFTDDLRQFLAQLPADIIAKLQIIDDYGDEANFTGVKKGQPEKMLNLVIKPGFDKGRFGNTGLTAATDKQYGLFANANLWQGDKQLSAGGSFSKADDLQGLQNSNSANGSYRNTFGHTLVVHGSENYVHTISQLSNQSYLATVIGANPIYNTSNSTDRRTNDLNTLDFGIDYRPDKDNFLTVTPSVNIVRGSDLSNLTSVQNGAINQTVYQNGTIRQSTNSFGVIVAAGHHFDKANRTLSIHLDFKVDKSENNSLLYDSIVYRGTDSLSKRLLNNAIRETSFSGTITYTEPLSKASSIDVSYTFKAEHQQNELLTSYQNAKGLSLVDSLSSNFSSVYKVNIFSLDYRFNTSKTRLIAGMTYEPSDLSGQSPQIAGGTHNTSRNFAPALNYEYALSATDKIQLGLSGTTVPPTVTQLLPQKNSQNIENIVLGNPDLKSAFAIKMRAGYTHILPKGGVISFSGNAEFDQNKIVSNLLLINTTGLATQETTFLNADGTRNINAAYNFATPTFSKKGYKYLFNISGGVGYSNTISYANNIRGQITNYNYAQTVSTDWSFLKFGIRLSAGDRYTQTLFTNGGSLNTYYNTLQFAAAPRYQITPAISFNADINKIINTGQKSSLATNPLIANASLNIRFLKRKAGEVQLQMADIFNQANNFVQSYGNNTVSERRTDYVTRYLKLKFTYRLSNFGPKEVQAKTP